MATPYIKREPGDLIKAQDWNDIQIQAREDIDEVGQKVDSHNHTGEEQGIQLSSDAIVNNSIKSQHIADGAIQTLHIQNHAVTADKIAPFGNLCISGNLDVAGNLGVGTAEPEAKLEVTADSNGPWLRLGRGGDAGRVWVEYGEQLAPLVVLSDRDDPPRIQFQQTGNGTEQEPAYKAWIGMTPGENNDLSIMAHKVGIGTATPQTTLDVCGTVRCEELEVNETSLTDRLQALQAEITELQQRLKVLEEGSDESHFS
jgi:hypothetical protein